MAPRSELEFPSLLSFLERVSIQNVVMREWTIRDLTISLFLHPCRRLLRIASAISDSFWSIGSRSSQSVGALRMIPGRKNELPWDTFESMSNTDHMFQLEQRDWKSKGKVDLKPSQRISSPLLPAVKKEKEKRNQEMTHNQQIIAQVKGNCITRVVTFPYYSVISL